VIQTRSIGRSCALLQPPGTGQTGGREGGREGAADWVGVVPWWSNTERKRTESSTHRSPGLKRLRFLSSSLPLSLAFLHQCLSPTHVNGSPLLLLWVLRFSNLFHPLGPDRANRWRWWRVDRRRRRLRGSRCCCGRCYWPAATACRLRSCRATGWTDTACTHPTSTWPIAPKSLPRPPAGRTTPAEPCRTCTASWSEARCPETRAKPSGWALHKHLIPIRSRLLLLHNNNY